MGADLIASGERIPDFALRASDNSVWTREHLLRGRRALLVVFRRDCPASRLLLPLVERMHRRLLRAGLRVAGLSQDSHADTLELADGYSLTFPLLLDFPSFEFSARLGVRRVPSQITLDAAGTVLTTLVGFSRREQGQLFLRLARELEQPEVDLLSPVDIVPERHEGSPSASSRPEGGSGDGGEGSA